ncbi:MAG: hypothetical protein ACI8QZ_001983 [Chlamydiales bacterium]|jgi:hypothetical protein
MIGLSSGRSAGLRLAMALLTGVPAFSAPRYAAPTQDLPQVQETPHLTRFVELLRLDGEAEGGGMPRLESLLDGAVAQALAGKPAVDAAAAVALLDLAHWELDGPPSPGDLRPVTRAGRLRAAGYDALDRILSQGAAQAWLDWLGEEVVLRRERHDPARRRTALRLLMDRRADAGKLAILTVARDLDDPLRAEALREMPAWHDEAIDLFLVGCVGRTFDKRGGAPHPFNLLLERVRDTDYPLGIRATRLLERRLAYMLISPDWRIASRGIELAGGLDGTVGIPLLLDALAAWNRRLEFGGGSKRMQYEILHELQDISGTDIGPFPRRWRTWWIAVRQGRTPLKRDLDPDVPRTSASFFGLRPVSDRVTFVIDLSGSMQTEWGTSEHSRYQEAIEQMMQFLQASGERTRFNVILFNSQTVRSSAQLVAATTDTLERARAELLLRVPDLGTELRPAIELALRMDLAGQFDVERFDADTIVVLCDGETAEGRHWVAPLLQRIQAEARVVFHCVLIGTAGDGTLEALAELSGGEFIRVGG